MNWFIHSGRFEKFLIPKDALSRVLALALASLVLAVPHALAQEETAEEKGLRIAREASARNDGFGDFTAGMTMVLRDRQGRRAFVRCASRCWRCRRTATRACSCSISHGDVQGTALLTHAHTNAQDDQWLYLPALKRVKRINAAKRSGSFHG